MNGSEDEAHRRGNGTNISRPDPTPATTSLLLREISSLKELTEQRMDGMAEAIKVAHEDMVRFPTKVQESVAALKDVLKSEINSDFRVHEEKFSSITMRFAELDKRATDAGLANEKALQAALKAQKELGDEQNRSSAAAVLKAEDRTTKQMDQLMALIKEVQNGLQGAIGEVKERIGRIENTATGRAEQLTTIRDTSKDNRDSTSLWVAIGGLVLGIVLGALGIIIAK